MWPEVPPLFSGPLPLCALVIVADPSGRSPIGGRGIARTLEIVAGTPWRVHVDMGPWRVARVPPSWVTPDPAAAANVVPLPDRRETGETWAPALFTDAPGAA